MTLDPFRRVTRLEWASGALAGLVELPDPLVTVRRPREALEQALLPALQRSRCGVTFSGGRDSSAVLAVAVHVARRHGLADPVPVTLLHREHRGTDEERFQESVVRHLGLRDWVRLPGDAAQDVLGAAARAGLARNGEVWPPTVYGSAPAYEVMRGGVLLTGHGGDEVLGPRRITPWVGTVRRRPRPSRRLVAALAESSAPADLRRRLARHRLDRSPQWSWLIAPARQAVIDAVAAEVTAEPLHWGRALVSLARRRMALVGNHNLAAVAAQHRVELVHPLLTSPFVASLAQVAGRFGFVSRTELMRILFADLLPDAVLARRSKARFNSITMGPNALQFAREWDGTGVDADLVDPDRLRAAWLAPQPLFGALGLLQSTWRSHGRERHTLGAIKA